MLCYVHTHTHTNTHKTRKNTYSSLQTYHWHNLRSQNRHFIFHSFNICLVCGRRQMLRYNNKIVKPKLCNGTLTKFSLQWFHHTRAIIWVVIGVCACLWVSVFVFCCLCLWHWKMYCCWIGKITDICYFIYYFIGVHFNSFQKK